MGLSDYGTFGKSGLKVSPLTLGTMTFDSDWGWGADPSDAQQILAYYIENRGQQLSGRNAGRISTELPEKTYQIIEELTLIAKERNVPVSAVAIAWVMRQSGVTSTLLGARTVDQLQQNIKAPELKLSDKEIESLNALSVPPKPFPYNMMDGMEDLLQGGTTINGLKSKVSPALPQHNEERYE